MIIDFHTHIFPDKIAERTVSLLEKNGGTRAYSDGTARGLVSRLEEAGADLAVNLPVLTSPAQFDSITRFASSLNEDLGKGGKILSFAGIHPDCEDLDGKMRYIKELGFLGVKIHPDYQETFINDERYVRIFNLAREYDLIVVTHSGIDGAYRDRPVKCTPELALELLRRAPHKKAVFAHLGSNEMADEVLSRFVDADVYFDTAFALKHTPKETVTEIIRRHGAERMLFASDSPWSGIAADLEIIRSLPISDAEKDMILGKNAQALLAI